MFSWIIILVHHMGAFVRRKAASKWCTFGKNISFSPTQYSVDHWQKIILLSLCSTRTRHDCLILETPFQQAYKIDISKCKKLYINERMNAIEAKSFHEHKFINLNLQNLPLILMSPITTIPVRCRREWADSGRKRQAKATSRSCDFFSFSALYTMVWPFNNTKVSRCQV